MSQELPPLLQSVAEIKEKNRLDEEERVELLSAQLNRLAIQSAVECAS